jgi:drug/metabolite transporter (DMT)-like permease
MSLKTAIVLTLMVLAGAFGDILVSKGMKQVGEITFTQPAALLRAGIRAAHNPYVVTGVLGLAVYFFSFSTVLSWEDVSLVVPISALSFLITTFVAQRSLGEHVTPQRWCGTILIVLGVILVARSQAVGSLPRRHGDTESRGGGGSGTAVRQTETDYAEATGSEEVK